MLSSLKKSRIPEAWLYMDEDQLRFLNKNIMKKLNNLKKQTNSFFHTQL